MVITVYTVILCVTAMPSGWVVSSHLENTAESTAEILLSTYQNAQSYNPEDHKLINGL
jgi:hypothetical protein